MSYQIIRSLNFKDGNIKLSSRSNNVFPAHYHKSEIEVEEVTELELSKEESIMLKIIQISVEGNRFLSSVSKHIRYALYKVRELIIEYEKSENLNLFSIISNGRYDGHSELFKSIVNEFKKAYYKKDDKINKVIKMRKSEHSSNVYFAKKKQYGFSYVIGGINHKVKTFKSQKELEMMIDYLTVFNYEHIRSVDV